jgi:hypothetical protein
MKYMALIYGDENREQTMTPDDYKTEMDAYYAFGAKAGERAVAGEALHPTRTAKTVRVRDGQVLTTDGPFAETKEQLGGYYILECDNLDEALEIASWIPGAKNGSIEVRPIVIFEPRE